MNKAQKVVVWFFVITMLVMAVLYFFYVRATPEIAETNSSNASITLYYGETCPHCKIVEEFIVNNSVESKITIIHKEVFINKTNALELEKIARSCNLDTTKIGVPFLDAEGKCYVGDEPIIAFLQTKLNSIKV
jgi:glutaredoxin